MIQLANRSLHINTKVKLKQLSHVTFGMDQRLRAQNLMTGSYNITFVLFEHLLANGHFDITQCQHIKFYAAYLLKLFYAYCLIL